MDNRDLNKLRINPNVKVDPASVRFNYKTTPIKPAGGPEALTDTADKLKEQAQAAVACLVYVDHTKTPGSCGDERERVGLFSGQPIVEPRNSVFGGPNVHALGVAELVGYFGPQDETDGEERLARVTGVIEAAGFMSGGHGHCAANGGLNTWMAVIASNPDAIKAYASVQLGDRYNDDAMNNVIQRAQGVVSSDRYGHWTEAVLPRVLGDKAGYAMEEVEGEHEGITVVRNKIPGTTVDHTALVEHSKLGVGSFVVDDPYAAGIEAAIASGPGTEQMLLEAAHAREAIIAAVASVVPNETLYEITLEPAA